MSVRQPCPTPERFWRAILEVAVAYAGDAVSQRKVSSVFQAVAQLDCVGAGAEWGEAELGLPRVGRLVELLGGRIWAERKTGMGTSCTFILPVVDPLDGGGIQAASALSCSSE
jgi:signal transduction histidine kinase